MTSALAPSCKASTILTSFANLGHCDAMTPNSRPLVQDENPELASALRELLEQKGETILAAKMRNLTIFDNIEHDYGSTSTWRRVQPARGGPTIEPWLSGLVRSISM